MKRILFVHRSLVCGGIETALLDLCSLLDKEKYDVSILCFYKYHMPYETFLEEAGIKVTSDDEGFYTVTDTINNKILKKDFKIEMNDDWTYKVIER